MDNLGKVTRFPSQENDDESEQRVDPHPQRRRTDRQRHVDWGPILAITVACALYASIAHYLGWL